MCSLMAESPPALPPSPTLQAIYATHQVQDASGTSYPLHSEIPPAFARALYQTTLEERPALVVEIGMAYGLSSLAILAALRQTGGQLISIDPGQSSGWHGVGVANVARDGLMAQHRLIEQPDYLALPDLLASDIRIDLAYIDGWHTFDYTLLDWFYCDKLLHVGGILAFNDCSWQSVYRAIRCLLTHRHYKELDVGLPRNYQGRFGFSSLLQGFRKQNGADRYFRKQDAFEPDWTFYHHF